MTQYRETSAHDRRFMNRYCIRVIASMVCTIILAAIPFSHIIAKANNEVLVTEQCAPEQIRFDFEFSTNEATGMIESFDVSDDGRIATQINPCSINIYDTFGCYDFTIDTNITRTHVTLQWNDDILFIYLYSSDFWDSSYDCIKIHGYEDYEIFSCPVNDDTKHFWEYLEQHESELITDKGRYYVEYGNLRYTDNESEVDYAITENTSFRPWWLLSIPILTAIIWFGFFRKRVKEWEKKHSS